MIIAMLGENISTGTCTANWLSISVVASINPLSPNSDEDQFSPNDIHTLSRYKVMRINEMITKEKML